MKNWKTSRHQRNQMQDKKRNPKKKNKLEVKRTKIVARIKIEW